jgi:adenosylhomocysteinase
MTHASHHVRRDLAFVDKGRHRIEWAARAMPVLGHIAERFAREQPLGALQVAACRDN